MWIGSIGYKIKTLYLGSIGFKFVLIRLGYTIQKNENFGYC